MLVRFADSYVHCAHCNARSERLIDAWSGATSDRLSGIYRCYNCRKPSVVTPMFVMRGPFRVPTFHVSSEKACEAKIARLYDRIREGYDCGEVDILSCKQVVK